MKNGEILYCGEYTGFAGGIERFAFQTALCLRKAGWHVGWCGRRGDRNEALFRSGFDTVQTVENALEQTRGYDLVVLHKVPDLEILNRMRERFGGRLVFLAHDHDLYCPRRHYYTPFGRINCHRAYDSCLCPLCARITSPRNWRGLKKHQSALLRELSGHHAAVLSSFMKNNLMRNGFREELIHFLPPVIETRTADRKTADDGTLDILFLGQLIRGKGADLLLRALPLLSIPWRLTIAGDGNDRVMLEKLAASLKIADRVHFMGWTENPDRCFAACDVAVFPSRWQEPFGLSGAEALAHGVPVVAFDTGGVREWLEDGVSGFAAPEKDLRALADRLETLGRDGALRVKMGRAGMERMREHFAPQCFLSAVEQLTEAVKR